MQINNFNDIENGGDWLGSIKENWKLRKLILFGVPYHIKMIFAILTEHFYHFSCSCETRNLTTSVNDSGDSPLKM